MKVTVIFTCFNRKEKTLNCINSLVEGNPGVDLDFIVVDDNSRDGTPQAVAQIGCKVQLISGNGSLYWAGGMRKGIGAYLERTSPSDYILLVNDDVAFYPGTIQVLADTLKENRAGAVVGAICNRAGEFSYGGLRLVEDRKNDLYYVVTPQDKNLECHSFNCNCVLLPDKTMRDAGNFDPVYTHGMADYDYGFTVRRKGYTIYSTSRYVGECDRNSIQGAWNDKNASRWERLKAKESPKGSPFREWFHYMYKNHGLYLAIRYSISPYIRILLKR